MCEFKVTIKPGSYFFGLEINKRANGTIIVNQSVYIKKLLAMVWYARLQASIYADCKKLLRRERRESRRTWE